MRKLRLQKHLRTAWIVLVPRGTWSDSLVIDDMCFMQCVNLTLRCHMKIKAMLCVGLAD